MSALIPTIDQRKESYLFNKTSVVSDEIVKIWVTIS